jgi:hypothetical protein
MLWRGREWMLRTRSLEQGPGHNIHNKARDRHALLMIETEIDAGIRIEFVHTEY